MNKLPSLIKAVIGSALDRAALAAGNGDLACALLASLKRIRMVVSVQAGYGSACSLDDAIHAVFVERALALFGTADVPAVALPLKSAAARRASLILEDAAMSCLTLNAYFPGNTAMTLAVSTLAERLVECLGGIPDWGCVLRELRTADSDQEEEALGDERWTPAAVH
jgi:hypothetical protein